MAKFFSFFGVFVGTFKALDMIATGYLMEFSLDNLFVILTCLVIGNMVLNFMRKNICFQSEPTINSANDLELLD